MHFEWLGMAERNERQGLGMTVLREEAPQENQEVGEMVPLEETGGHQRSPPLFSTAA